MSPNNIRKEDSCDECGGSGQECVYDEKTGRHSSRKCTSCNGTGKK